nr:immunoglobulin heavy chain junction region [Mus musculus]MBK4196011.1 immunoglobulin heavy chain junction region [Mus musculus]
CARSPSWLLWYFDVW